MAIDPTIEKKIDHCPHFFWHCLKIFVTNFLLPTCDQIFLVVKVGNQIFWVVLEKFRQRPIFF
jgi:hypothetical protein